MNTSYINKNAEKITTIVTFIIAVIVTATFVLLHGFDEPLLSAKLLHRIQVAGFLLFFAEKCFRMINVPSKKDYLAANWIEIPLLILFIVVIYTAEALFPAAEPAEVKIFALGVYLIAQVLIKICRTTVGFAASGKNPTKTLIISFLVLIVAGAGMLMLPKSHNLESMSVVDALFTATSATCVTGLVVKDTGQDFNMMGQTIILVLIQLGGLGIVMFGAILALLLRQALSVSESVAMQDLLSAQTLGKISSIIGFVFITTILFEAAGALFMFSMWPKLPGAIEGIHEQWFCSIFHSISAFCNAGFGLFPDSLMEYNTFAPVYTVIAPLIILGGLGFGVLFNLTEVVVYRFKKMFRKRSNTLLYTTSGAPAATRVKVRLQTKIAVLTTVILIIVGTLALIAFEDYPTQSDSPILQSAFFQAVTARTAGFNTVNISLMSSANKLVLMVLMLIGGSPVSTAGGIKTVTLAVIIMAAYATMHKRKNVEIFKRTINPAIVARAVTVALLFAVIFIAASLLLSVTEKQNDFAFDDIMFETASALGTVGLSTGITSSLTTAGKVIIIIIMLVGRLGPLTLLAAMTFNIKPAGYDYAEEAIVVG